MLQLQARARLIAEVERRFGVDDHLAVRLKAKVVDESKLNPMQLEDTSALLFDLFQYMTVVDDVVKEIEHLTIEIGAIERLHGAR